MPSIHGLCYCSDMVQEYRNGRKQNYRRLTGVHAKELPSTRECTQDPTWANCMWKEEKNKGGRGLMSVEDVVQYESHSLNHVHKR